MAEADGFIPVKAEKVVDVGLSLLERDTALAQTVWRNAAGDFRGAKDDTISIRVPAYAVANKRALRSTDARVRSTLHQRKVDVTLTHDLQVDVEITDEELTLDIMSLTAEVVAPSTAAIVRGYEDEVATLQSGATYNTTLPVDEDDPYDTLVDARIALNDARVPQSGRTLVVGSTIEAQILKSEHLARFDQSGSDTAFREAQIGRIAGFTVMGSEALAPDEGFAYHRTAYVLNTRAPFVPQGVAWGSVQARNGFAIRVMQHLDNTADGPANIVYHDAWVGTNIVQDHGAFDENGKFVPSVEPDLENGTDLLFVRAVKLTAAASSS